MDKYHVLASVSSFVTRAQLQPWAAEGKTLSSIPGARRCPAAESSCHHCEQSLPPHTVPNDCYPDHDAHDTVFCTLCLTGKKNSKRGRGSVTNTQENADLAYKVIKLPLDILQQHFQGSLAVFGTEPAFLARAQRSLTFRCLAQRTSENISRMNKRI